MRFPERLLLSMWWYRKDSLPDLRPSADSTAFTCFTDLQHPCQMPRMSNMWLQLVTNITEPAYLFTFLFWAAMSGNPPLLYMYTQQRSSVGVTEWLSLLVVTVWQLTALQMSRVFVLSNAILGAVVTHHSMLHASGPNLEKASEVIGTKFLFPLEDVCFSDTKIVSLRLLLRRHYVSESMWKKSNPSTNEIFARRLEEAKANTSLSANRWYWLPKRCVLSALLHKFH